MQMYNKPAGSEIVLEIQNRHSHELFIIVRCKFVHFKKCAFVWDTCGSVDFSQIFKGLGHSNVLKFKAFILILDC